MSARPCAIAPVRCGARLRRARWLGRRLVQVGRVHRDAGSDAVCLRNSGQLIETGVCVRIVDLSHHYEDGMPIFPGLADPSFKPIAEVERDGYAMSEYRLLNHIGTHVDAPAHQI